MNSLIDRIATGLLVTGLALSGCAAQISDDLGKGETGAASGGKEDRWNHENDPSLFEGELNYRLADLPQEGRTEHDAWPSTYWPTYEDSINHRWHNGELSPAEKYDTAFNGWTPSADFMALRPFSRSRPTEWDDAYYQQLGPLARHVSSNMGNQRDRQASRADADGRPDEWPVETWWGLCHAWVPAAINEPRPMRTVTYNGVDFHVGDLEALLIAAHNRTPAAMIGGRCNVGNGETSVERDATGRAVDVECRDTNAGALHVIMTNYLGLMHRPFAEDRTYDYQVWNQPVVAFSITKQDEISVARANELLSTTGDTYAYNPDAAKLYEVNATLTYITEASASTTPADTSRHERTDRYTYILEVDQAGLVIGGEYVGGSRSNHPDFLWNPRMLTRSTVSNLDLAKVRMLVQMSREAVTPPTPGGENEYEVSPALAIPDNNPTGIVSTVNVPDAQSIRGLQVELDITHSYRGDLQVALAHGGVERVIHNREGGSADNLRTTLTVAGFENADAQGEWRLIVRDLAGQDTGTLNRWKLIVVGGEGGGGGGGGGSTAGTFPGAGGIAIPDNNTTGITSTASVPAGTTGTAQASINITHTYIGDLMVKLQAPSGTTWTLHNRAGSSADDIVRSFPLSPAPTGDLGGAWTLTVLDRAGRDVGTLNSWSLVVSP